MARRMTGVLQRPKVKAVVRPLIVVFGTAVARGVELALRLTSRRIGIAVMYHAVATRQGDKTREIVAPHGVDVFERQLRHLRGHYRIVESRDLLEATRTRRRGERFPVAVTLDDDLSCHAQVALPVLQRLGIPATFFLSGASLSRPFSFWWERLQHAFDEEVDDIPGLLGIDSSDGSIHELGRVIEAMSPEDRDAVAARLAAVLGPDPPQAGIREDEARRLAEAGMTIGFHTLRHDPMPALDEAALAGALRAGRDELEAIAKRSLDVIGYPHGKADDRVAEAARAAGFTTGFTVTGAPVHSDSDPLLLGRITPTYRSPGHFAVQLALELLSRQR